MAKGSQQSICLDLKMQIMMFHKRNCGCKMYFSPCPEIIMDNTKVDKLSTTFMRQDI